jgi:hypothetical protein
MIPIVPRRRKINPATGRSQFDYMGSFRGGRGAASAELSDHLNVHNFHYSKHFRIAEP